MKRKQLLISLTASADAKLRKNNKKKGDITKQVVDCIYKAKSELMDMDLTIRKPGIKKTTPEALYFTSVNINSELVDELNKVARIRLTSKSVLVEACIMKYLQ